jgi:hypothetical protein
VPKNIAVPKNDVPLAPATIYQAIKDLPQTRQFEAYLGADARNLLGADVMNVKELIGLFNRRWPIVFVAASAAITVVWIGALIWFVVELLRGFSGI